MVRADIMPPHRDLPSPRTCQQCQYYRPATTPRRAPFWAFTGERSLPPDGCAFFALVEVKHADL